MYNKLSSKSNVGRTRYFQVSLQNFTVYQKLGTTYNIIFSKISYEIWGKCHSVQLLFEQFLGYGKDEAKVISM